MSLGCLSFQKSVKRFYSTGETTSLMKRRVFAATFFMSFLRHPQIYPSICSMAKTGDGPFSGFAPGPHRLDESAAGYSLAGCAPAEPASASPGDYEYAVQSFYWSRSFHPTANSVLTVCVSPGGKRIDFDTTSRTSRKECLHQAGSLFRQVRTRS